MQARSYNRCCCAKAISVAYSECVFVALSIRLLQCVSVALGICLLQWKSYKYYIFSVRVCSLRYPFVAVEKQ